MERSTVQSCLAAPRSFIASGLNLASCSSSRSHEAMRISNLQVSLRLMSHAPTRVFVLDKLSWCVVSDNLSGDQLHPKPLPSASALVSRSSPSSQSRKQLHSERLCTCLDFFAEQYVPSGASELIVCQSIIQLPSVIPSVFRARTENRSQATGMM